MKYDVAKKKWSTYEDKEQNCEFFRGGCKATSQKKCRLCRFVSPNRGEKIRVYEEIIPKLYEENERIKEELAVAIREKAFIADKLKRVIKETGYEES